MMSVPDPALPELIHAYPSKVRLAVTSSRRHPLPPQFCSRLEEQCPSVSMAPHRSPS